ncbi:hypothetical protein a10_08579 [Streptomyces acidiscabies]|nr:hypothetical protein a10_08579 [Streptomyces acidiscabies]GAV45535.1 hypothetical protein Saa2_08526 [Streptomyces acidiscabies]
MAVPMTLDDCPTDAASRASYVTWTVVSVMPYMLTSTGASSAWWAYQSVRRAGSRASPPKITYRSERPEASEGSW